MYTDSYSKAQKWWKWLKLRKVKWLTFDFEKSDFDRLLYPNVIWILKKWMWIHAWKVEITQGGNYGKKSKCSFWSKFDFDLNDEMIILPFD